MERQHRARTVAVLGAGSVGCYFGAVLAQAGIGVTLIGREEHVDAIRARGLLLERGTRRDVVALQATTEAMGVADADVVLVCVKSGDTETAGREMATYLRSDAAVVSLQNGVDNAERLQSVLNRPVIPAVVYVATEMAGPGHVRHHGRGELVLGSGNGSAEVAALFAAAGIPATVSETAIDALWAKLIVNCAYNALSALTRLPYGRMLALSGIAAVMRDVVAESSAVARASGIHLPEDILASVLALAETMPTQSSSTAQDLARGMVSEIDHLNGFIVRTGEALGIPTPVNRVLHTLIKAAEAQMPRRSGTPAR